MKIEKCIIQCLIVLVLILMQALAGCSSSTSSAGSTGEGSVVDSAVTTTVKQQILPVAIAPDTPGIAPREVSLYETYGYSAWQVGPGLPIVKRTELAPLYNGAVNVARLMHYFTSSDNHITDKESPAEALYFGWSAVFLQSGLYSQAYSPVCLSTTQVIDAAVRTINALNRQQQFDFGIFLGDAANSSQLNELHWFLDVVDGRYVTPSSGAHLGSDIIDYQKPYQAAGLDSSILWYQAIGNHDQYWMGTHYPTLKVRTAQGSDTILNMGDNVFAPNAIEGTGTYVGVVDGTTIYGDVIYGGPVAGMIPPNPTVAADSNRISLTTATSSTTNFIDQFFNYSTSLPVGHGFNRSHTGSLAACYSFVPKSNIPLKIIVLDDTCKTTVSGNSPNFYGDGWMDTERLNWLTGELQAGQDANQLMIIAAHIPVNPQTGISDTTPDPQFYVDPSDSGVNITDAQFVAFLQQYPNLLMFMAGHRHENVVTPQPSTDPAHPENGFWEVETSSTRDFPQQFRIFDIRRNSDNTISILTINVDPDETPGSVADKSRGYAVGAIRLFGKMPLNDTTSHAYNAELIKQLTPQMQSIIANYGSNI
ncbi:MAG: TIGR03768 family metallophosphoesterase [Vulcanimicrobiota bacterium]